MQHVLRCWERQSDGSEYKKTLRWPGLCPGPRWGSLQRSRKPPSWWGRAGCPIPRSRHFGPRLFYPHSKLSSDAVECFLHYAVGLCKNVIQRGSISSTRSAPCRYSSLLFTFLRSCIVLGRNKTKNSRLRTYQEHARPPHKHSGFIFNIASLNFPSLLVGIRRRLGQIVWKMIWKW